MRNLIAALFLGLTAAAIAGAATAQVAPYPQILGPQPFGAPAPIPGTVPGTVPGALQSDPNTYAIEQIRRQSEANAALARQQQVQTQSTLQALEAARSSQPTTSPFDTDRLRRPQPLPAPQTLIPAPQNPEPPPEPPLASPR